MSDQIFQFADHENIGEVFKVDSYSVAIHVPEEENLRNVSVNGLVVLCTRDANVRLVGRVDRVIRLKVESESVGEEEVVVDERVPVESIVYINALGTLKGPGGGRARATFTRSVEMLPEVGAQCYLLTGERLSVFTALVAEESVEKGRPLSLGHFTMAVDAEAVLDGNAFFQRHALVVGSTGSGKSWTVARIIEQVAGLPRANMLVFDLHGEYRPLAKHPKVKRYRIAGPGDLQHPGDDVLFLPYWLLGYEDMLTLILDRSDENAPNQAMAFSNAVRNAKEKALRDAGLEEIIETFTIDSPIPYSLDDVVAELEILNTQQVEGKRGPKDGPFVGRFSRFLPRLLSKRRDRRYGFLFSLGREQLHVNYLDNIVKRLMVSASEEDEGVKIIDFSEVPSDILPIVLSIVARLVFQIQQWTSSANRHPIALVCDEAHLYLPSRQAADASEGRALAHFERIAKEGRKYGLSLVIISQRPSELNTTVISQCNNVISLRLSNQADKNAVANLLPENLGGIQNMLPTLGQGEAIVVGDACLLPSRIKVKEPEYKPDSRTIRIWDRWSGGDIVQDLSQAVQNLLRQTKTGRSE
jgi:DNA helicase HerA-like ATPase